MSPIDLVNDYPRFEYGETCDCGHPVKYHREREGRGVEACTWCPPHGFYLCRCNHVTTTGVVRDERAANPATR